MDELIVKYLQGNCTNKEKETLFSWVDQDPQNKDHFRHLRQTWDLNTLLDSPAESEEKLDHAYHEVWQKIESKQAELGNPFRRRLIVAMRYAAVAVIFFLAAWFVREYTMDGDQAAWHRIEVPVGQKVKITLADGTLVWLNSKSSFSYPQNFGKKSRHVILNGEGYFEVAHDKELPFVVQTKKAEISVMGTKFNVYAYENEPFIETTLLEGKVLFSERRDKINNRILKPKQQLLFDSGSGDIHVSDVDPQVFISWVNGAYFFNNTTIRDIFLRLTHYYNVEVEVRDSSILDYTCVGKFRTDESLSDILKVISTSKPFRYKINDRKVTIY